MIKKYRVCFTYLYWSLSETIEAFSERNARNIFRKQFPGVKGNGRILSIKEV